MYRFLTRVVEAGARFEAWVALVTLFSTWGLFAWLSSRWSFLMDFGWPAVTILSLLAAAIVSGGFALVALAIKAWQPSQLSTGNFALNGNPNDKLIEIIGKHFKNETIIIDGHHLINCEATDCVIQYNGGHYAFTNFTRHSRLKFATAEQKIAHSIKLLQFSCLMHENTSGSEIVVPLNRIGK